MFIEINDDIEIIDIMSDRVSFFCNQVLTEKVIDKIINIVDHLPENLDVFIYVPSKFVKYTENYSRILFIKEYPKYIDGIIHVGGKVFKLNE